MNNMINKLGAHYSDLNIFWIYGIVAIPTLLVLLDRLRLFKLPRPLLLLSWYAVVLLATSWLLFHVIYFFAHNPRDSGLATIARGLSFLPIYVYALILAFVYPMKRTERPPSR